MFTLKNKCLPARRPDLGPLSVARYLEMLGMFNFTLKAHYRGKGLTVNLLPT